MTLRNNIMTLAIAGSMAACTHLDTKLSESVENIQTDTENKVRVLVVGGFQTPKHYLYDMSQEFFRSLTEKGIIIGCKKVEEILFNGSYTGTSIGGVVTEQLTTSRIELPGAEYDIRVIKDNIDLPDTPRQEKTHSYTLGVLHAMNCDGSISKYKDSNEKLEGDNIPQEKKKPKPRSVPYIYNPERVII